MNSSLKPLNQPGPSGDGVGEVASEAASGEFNLSLPNRPLVIGMGFFWQFALVAAFLPIVPIYFSDRGVSASGIAFLLSVQALVALLVTQITGYLADTKYQRTSMLIFMSVMGSLVAALFPLLPATIPWLSLGMVAMSLFFGQRIQLYNALVLDSRRGEELFGPLRVVGSLSFAVLVVIMGRLADLPLFTSAFMWPALVVAELGYTVSIMLMRDVSPGKRPGNPRATGFRQSQKVLLGNRLMLKFLFFILLLQIAGGPPHILQIKFMRDLGASGMFTTACLSFAAVSETFIFFFGNRVLKRVRLMWLFLFVPLGVIARFGLIALFPIKPVIFASNIFHLFVFGLGYLCGVIFINREAPPELKSSAQTIFALVYATIAGFLGNQWASWLLEWLNRTFGMTDTQALRIYFGSVCLIAALALLAWLPMKREYERKHKVSGFWIQDPTG